MNRFQRTGDGSVHPSLRTVFQFVHVGQRQDLDRTPDGVQITDCFIRAGCFRPVAGLRDGWNTACFGDLRWPQTTESPARPIRPRWNPWSSSPAHALAPSRGHPSDPRWSRRPPVAWSCVASMPCGRRTIHPVMRRSGRCAPPANALANPTSPATPSTPPANPARCAWPWRCGRVSIGWCSGRRSPMHQGTAPRSMFPPSSSSGAPTWIARSMGRWRGPVASHSSRIHAWLRPWPSGANRVGVRPGPGHRRTETLPSPIPEQTEALRARSSDRITATPTA